MQVPTAAERNEADDAAAKANAVAPVAPDTVA
jgi:hypothetical protein